MRRALLLIGCLALVGACGDGDGATCGPITEEALDPGSGSHILPDAPPPSYTSDPPTSGPHYALEPPTGVVDEPIERPLQVTILEAGGVLLQHTDDLSDEDIAALAALASDEVVVAPNPDLADPLVMTAWLRTQSCSGVDQDAVEDFIAEHRGGGPGSDI